MCPQPFQPSQGLALPGAWACFSAQVWRTGLREMDRLKQALSLNLMFSQVEFAAGGPTCCEPICCQKLSAAQRIPSPSPNDPLASRDVAMHELLCQTAVRYLAWDLLQEVLAARAAAKHRALMAAWLNLDERPCAGLGCYLCCLRARPVEMRRI